MSEFIDNYRRHVLELLERPGSHPRSWKLEREQFAKALFLPSFDPETLIEISHQAASTELRFVTFSRSIWDFEMEERDNLKFTGLTDWLPPKPPQRFEEIVNVSNHLASAFWTKIERLCSIEPKDSGRLGLDGMTIIATYQTPSAKFEFEDWSPERTSLQHQYCTLLCDLAWSSVDTEESRESLIAIHGYLRRELPVASVKCEIRCLRIFSSLDVEMQPQFNSLIESLPVHEPVIIQVYESISIDPDLFESFQSLNESHSNLIWVAINRAEQLLKKMGISEKKIFNRQDGALMHLNQTGRDAK